MLGFNDQRGRGCILAGRRNDEKKKTEEEKERERERERSEERKRAREGQANNVGRKKARRSSQNDLSSKRSPKGRARTTHGVRYWRTLSHYWLPLRTGIYCGLPIDCLRRNEKKKKGQWEKSEYSKIHVLVALGPRTRTTYRLADGYCNNLLFFRASVIPFPS